MSDTATYATRHGPMIGLAHDVYMSPSLDRYGEYCPDELHMLAQLVKPGMTVVEVGANIGTHTVPLARACAPAKLYAFEPQQRVFQILCANLVLNDVVNVIARPEAVGADAGVVLIPDVDYGRDGNFGGLSLEQGWTAGLPTSVVALDAVALPSCGLLKIDAEGFEPQVLRGAREMIARCRPVIYMENDRHHRENILLVAEMGYDLYWHLPPLFSPNNFNNCAENLFGNVRSINMLCLPSERKAHVSGLEAIDPEAWRKVADGEIPVGPIS